MSKPLLIITGASSGIGAATAELFAQQGHPLLLIARRLEKLEALSLPNTLCKQVDVTDFTALTQAIQEAEALFGPADAIINNAGTMLLGAIDTQQPEEWKKMFDVNVLGVLHGMQAVLPQMKQRQRGTIINISSIAGRKTFPNHAAYCGTKFGVHAISENTREEVASFGVRVVTIAPGAVETELLSHTSSDSIKNAYEEWKNTMGQVLHPTEVAQSILFAYQQPQHLNIREIVLAATKQEA